MKSDGCLFCKIASGETPSAVVLDDETSLAFLDHRPLFPGHCLLVPKTHYATFMDLPAKLLEPLFSNGQLITRAMEEALQAEGSFVAINNRVSQSVPHMHVHIVPRRKGDGLKGFFWPRRPYKDENELVRTQTLLREAINRLKRSGG